MAATQTIVCLAVAVVMAATQSNAEAADANGGIALKGNIYFLKPNASAASGTRVGAGYECGDFFLGDGEEAILVSGDDNLSFTCTTNLQSPAGTTLSLECPHFDLAGKGCSLESLVITDPFGGQSVTGCQRNAPSFSTTSNGLQMVHTRGNLGRRCTGGFMCTVRAGSKPEALAQCKKQTIQRDEDLVVYSANDGSKTKCKHQIEGPAGTTLVMSCPIFSLRQGCNKEKLVFSKGRFGLDDSKTTYCEKEGVSATSKSNKLVFRHIRKPLRKKCSGGFLCLVSAVFDSTGDRPFCSGCGISQVTVPRIVGGEEATPGEYPWQALLDFGRGVICGGSLIKNAWVLTAAHCFEETGATSVTVVLGEHDRSTTTDGVTQQFVSSNFIVHPNYDKRTQDNDIALVFLGQNAVFNERVRPICLAQEADYVTGASTIVTGWGVEAFSTTTAKAKLQEVTLDLISTSSCVALYPDYTITDNMICTLTANKDACQGDSGGPLVTQTQDGSWAQLGVVSFGDECAKENSPGVYTKVANYYDWITEQTGSNQC
ncbi:venom serine protease 34-like [Penaeus chinensis]|uniref:venom serine protease 34-like n=1 Tax=Penaeus chinensis TaxID=139456 RepID=UPI001FB7694C|nr:venom serine protease 34-like [Penaeus chinensis]